MNKRPTKIRSQLLGDLKELRLPAMRECYEEEAQRAQQETLSYEQYLFELAERECQARRQHRVERFLRESRLPLDKSLGAFEMKRMPRKVTQQVRTLLDGSFLDRRENILAFGNPGSGKTHLLCALGQELIRAGRRIYFTPTALLVQDLLRAKQELKLARQAQERPMGHSILYENYVPIFAVKIPCKLVLGNILNRIPGGCVVWEQADCTLLCLSSVTPQNHSICGKKMQIL